MNIRRHIGALAASGLLAAAAACGGDDDGAVSTTAPTVPVESTADQASDPPPGPDPVAYCDAHLALEAAANTEDDAAMGAAAGAAMAAAPAEIADALATAVENAPTGEGPPDPVFSAAYAEVVAWVQAECGFGELQIVATDYAFGGLPAEQPAGPTVIEITNRGTEFHEVALIRRGDGVTESFDDLLALPDEEIGGKATFLGLAIAAPGETGPLVADLVPGDYLAICFIPVGATPEALAGGPPPEGEPHFLHGMRQEFTVV